MEKRNVVIEVMQLMKNDPDEVIRQTIEAMATTIESEEEEKKELLSMGSFYNAMKMCHYVAPGSPMYQLYQTMAVSAFDGRDDIFHTAYRRFVERTNEIYELSKKDFELAKNYFIGFISNLDD